MFFGAQGSENFEVLIPDLNVVYHAGANDKS